MSKSLLKSSGVVSLLTLLSRLLGFVREIMLATAFGAGAAMDAFLVALMIPNFGRRMFAEGAFSQAFVPILAEYRTREGEDQTRSLVNRTATLLSLALLAVSALGIAHPTSATAPHVTISAGLALRQASHQSPQDLIHAADEALYRAKRSGRNRLEMVGDDGSDRPSMARAA